MHDAIAREPVTAVIEERGRRGQSGVELSGKVSEAFPTTRSATPWGRWSCTSSS
jgi:hypothetical protein